MSRDVLTHSYFEHVTRRGMRADELVDLAHRHVDLAATTYAGRCLSRPVFLDRDTHRRLADDVVNLHQAVTSLPDRLFGGDMAAFARAVGMTQAQVDAILRGRGERPTSLARADLYPDATGFRLMEVNMGSTVGGLDNAMLNRAFLAHPAVSEFVAAAGLSYVDTMAELAATLRAECAIADEERPFIAAVDWPASFATLAPQLRYSAEALALHGLDVAACHLGQLDVRDGRVWLDGRPVDIVYRVFMVEDLLDSRAASLVDPLLRAAERGEVRVFAPLDAELYGSKGALAMVSDEANREVHTAAELASLDRLLPWTRMVRPGPVTVDGQLVELEEYAVSCREELILKPTLLHAGSGVVPGWLVDSDEWRRRLAEAMDGPFVLQQRIRPEFESFPAADATDPEPWVLTWGIILGAQGYGGAFIRGDTDPDGGVVNMATGATATCCFHEAS